MSSTPTTQLARLSVSLPEQLLADLDVMVQERALPSRSQMIAELRDFNTPSSMYLCRRNW